MIYIKYNSQFDEELFRLWISHYKTCRLSYKIVVKDEVSFLAKYPLLKENTTRYVPDNDPLELTINDFLFTYDRDDNDNMMLTYHFNTTFTSESICIGRVFYVPVENKKKYTTFEIPDFILYKHTHHTNYTQNGIKIKGGKVISDNMVCFSMVPSVVAFSLQYFEMTYLHGSAMSQTIYNKIYPNLYVNKELLYGIVWFPKSACSTITTIFCKVNNIQIHSNNMRALLHFRPKYRFNHYLQGLQTMVFTRNPYHRFISTYIDKHVLQTDLIFNTLVGYEKFKRENKNNLSQLIDFIKKEYISDHYLIANRVVVPHNLFKSMQVHKIEDNLNLTLYQFFSKFHTNYIDKDFIMKCYNNVSKSTSKKNKKNIDNTIMDTDTDTGTNFSEMTIEEWRAYLVDNKVDYELILKNDPVLKSKIYEVYKEDFGNSLYYTFSHLKRPF